MITEYQQELASLYSLGALARAESDAFTAEMCRNPLLRDFTRDLQATLALAARAWMPTVPPPGLRRKVLDQIDEFEGNRRVGEFTPVRLAGPGLAMAAMGTGWKRLPVAGSSIKLLSLEPDRGYAVLLGKLEPGARYPAHVNAGPEDFYVLSGDLVIGDRKLVGGDFHHADAGSQHAENYSVTGCTLIAVLTVNDPLVAYAMA